MSSAEGLYGKFRGSVVNNVDPLRIGRVQISVPVVLGGAPAWAMPCVPLAGTAMGVWVVPPVGGNVWVEFEGGNADYPIWVGGWWSTPAEVPTVVADVSAAMGSIALQTGGQNAIVISDMPGPAGGVAVRTPGGAVIAVRDTEITISNGQGASIVLKGSVISLNDGQMTVP